MAKELNFQDGNDVLKYQDSNSTLKLYLSEDGLPFDLSRLDNMTLKVGNDNGYLLEKVVDLSNVSDPTSGNVTIPLDGDIMTKLIPDDYNIEIWTQVNPIVYEPAANYVNITVADTGLEDTQAIFPNDGTLVITVSENIKADPYDTINAYPLDDVWNSINEWKTSTLTSVTDQLTTQLGTEIRTWQGDIATSLKSELLNDLSNDEGVMRQQLHDVLETALDNLITQEINSLEDNVKQVTHDAVISDVANQIATIKPQITSDLHTSLSGELSNELTAALQNWESSTDTDLNNKLAQAIVDKTTKMQGDLSTELTNYLQGKLNDYETTASQNITNTITQQVTKSISDQFANEDSQVRTDLENLVKGTIQDDINKTLQQMQENGDIYATKQEFTDFTNQINTDLQKLNLANDIGNQIVQINERIQSIPDIQNNVNSLNSSVASNASSIASLTSSFSSNSTSASSAIASNASSINTLENTVNNNVTSNVSSLTSQIASVSSANNTVSNQLQSSINANTSAIASNSTSLANNISNNSNAIASNSNSIASNSINISNVASTTSSAIGSLYSTAINSNENISGIKNYENGIQIAGNSVYVQNQKLMYENKPVLIANAPNAPAISLSIDPNTANIQYQITPPSVDGGASVTSYTLYYKKDSDSDFTSVKLDKDSLIGQINSVSGANYQFKVSATNYAGDGFTSNIQSILSEIAPSNVSITIDNQFPNGIHYHITTGNNGGANVSGYQIYYKAVNDTNWQLFKSTQNDGYIASAVAGTNYMVKAKSQNIVGLSSDSNVANINYVDNQIYGVSWNQSSSPTLTRTDSAVGMVAGINGSRNDFDNTELWGGMRRVTDSYGNVFVRIPKFYIKKTQSSGLSTWQVSLIKRDSSWYLPKCFYNFTTNSELPYVDVGAYLGDINNNLLESKTGKSPSSNYAIDQFRQYAKNNGNGYQQLDIHVWDVLQTLFTVEFATLDSQSVMYGNSTYLNSGYTDNMNGSSAGDNNNIKYRGIESMYCNIYQFVDGIGINSTNIYVCNDANNYANSQFSYPYQQVGYNLPASSGYIQNIGLDLNNPEVSLPGATTSNLGYFSDYCWNDSGSNYQMVAGGHGSGSLYGLWCASVYSSFGYAYSSCGARLIRKAVS